MQSHVHLWAKTLWPLSDDTNNIMNNIDNMLDAREVDVCKDLSDFDKGQSVGVLEQVWAVVAPHLKELQDLPLMSWCQIQGTFRGLV